ncbi:MAG: preprotein translocase subunit SecA [Patescibacteria group bacterium]|nr:preprotein translocase subunit SecA [Patescibacteria group bacterium]
MLNSIFKFILGDPNQKILNTITPVMETINEKEAGISSLSDDQLRDKTQAFKHQLEKGNTLESIRSEAFAVVREAAKRVRGERHYDVQIIGGVALDNGMIAEMKTGEGKTLTSTLAAYLNALAGKGVHVITVNEYLARRDAQEMGEVFAYLGLTTGVVYHGMTGEERKAAYNCDITYGTNNEFGFDYLRDNMQKSMDAKVQRGHHYAIVDEIDSILIDEARTPLIISAPAEESTSKYLEYDRIVKYLERDVHYTIDEKAKAALLTEDGITKLEEIMKVDNIYTEKGFEEVQHIESALKARFIFEKDKDYVVQDDKVVIVDEFTGRLMAGRRYSDGIHQAIEAKEGVSIQRESRTLATITFQNYFRMYQKLSGMSGSAVTEAEEFEEIYGLKTLVIPTNRPMIRDDRRDKVFKNQKGKYMAMIAEIKERNAAGQPVLCGTSSIEQSEVISQHLIKSGVDHKVLNAKFHEQEAEIISRAGSLGAVTVATNMAGRGTDIKLEEGVRELGGLYVIGAQRHESRRIDNQLRGRAGRQGDPGTTQFYVALDDALMRMFGMDRLQGMMSALPDDEAIENSIVTRSIESAQKRVEGRNFETRKHLVKYDDVVNKHREIFYTRRDAVLSIDYQEEFEEKIIESLEKQIEYLVHSHVGTHGEILEKDLLSALKALHQVEFASDFFDDVSKDELVEKLQKEYQAALHQKFSDLSDDQKMQLYLSVSLRAMDTLWVAHLDEMRHLRESSSYAAYAQKDPLLEYKDKAYQGFVSLLEKISFTTVEILFRSQTVIQKSVYDGMQVEQKPQPQQAAESSVQDNRTEQLVSTKVVGRNDECPCGSGKKYKKCCGA